MSIFEKNQNYLVISGTCILRFLLHLIMLISFLYPFNLRNIEAPFLWVFHNQMSHLKSDEVVFILNESYLKGYEYFKTEKRWEADASFFQKDDFIVQKKYSKTILDETRLYEIYKSYSDDLSFFKAYLTENIPELESILYDALHSISKNEKIDAILSWSNCPSLSKACERLNLEIIYNEVGPLRDPIFKSTGYFDFKGVNGGTEAKNRFTNFQKKINFEQPTLLENKDLLELFLTSDYLYYLSVLDNQESEVYDIGLGLQVENDSNVIAYANGFDNEQLIQKYNKTKQKIAARKHPNGLKNYSDKIFIDGSENSVEFIKKSKKIATVNSGMAMEALIFGKQVEMLGDTPFLLLNSINKNDFDDRFKKGALNFLLLNYLIPFELMYSIDYIKFRLKEKDELTIFLYHLNYYRALNLKKNDVIDKYFNIKKVDPIEKAKIQIYLANEDGVFSENKSLFDYTKPNAHQQNIVFNLTSEYQNIRYIRFDIGEEPGFINIDEISIKDLSGDILWSFHTKDLYSKLGLLFIESEEYFQNKTIQLSISNDPQFSLKLPKPVLDKLSKGIVIHIKLSVLNNKENELLNKIIIKPLSFISQNELIELNGRINFFEVKNKEKLTIINNLQSEKNNLQDSIQGLNNKIISIETNYSESLKDHLSRIDILEKELSTQISINKNNTKEIEQKSSIIDELNKNIEALNKEIALQSSTIQSQQKLIQSESVEKNRIIFENNELNQALSLCKQQLSIQTDMNEGNEKEITNLNASIDDLTKKVNSLIDRYENKNIMQIAINRILKK